MTTGGTRLRLRSGSPDVARRPRQVPANDQDANGGGTGYDLTTTPPLKDLDVVAAGTAVAGSNLRLAALYDALPISGLKRGAAEYNVVRTGGWWGDDVQLTMPFDAADGTPEPVVVLPERPFSATAHRLLNVITGQWVRVGTTDCDPDVGRHGDGCGHRENRVIFAARDAAIAAFGSGGGSQRQQVRDALDELHDTKAGFLIHDPGSGRYLEERSHVLSFRVVGTVQRGPLKFLVAFDPFLLESLLAGHYTALPIEVVRNLTGPEFLLAQQVLSRPAVRRLTKAGQAHEWSVITGTRGAVPTIPPALLGLSGLRPDRLRRRYEAMVEPITTVIEPLTGFRLELKDGAKGGLNVRLVRTKDRVALRTGGARQAVEGGHDRPDEGHDRPVRGHDRPVRGHAKPRIVRESGGPVGVSSRGSSDEDSLDRHDTLEERRSENDERRWAHEPEDVRALLEHGWSRVTERQRQLLYEVAEVHDLNGRSWAARIIRDTPPGADPLAAVMKAHNEYMTARRGGRPDRRGDDAVADYLRRWRAGLVDGSPHPLEPQPTDRASSAPEPLSAAMVRLGVDPATIEAWRKTPRRRSPPEEPTE